MKLKSWKLFQNQLFFSKMRLTKKEVMKKTSKSWRGIISMKGFFMIKVMLSTDEEVSIQNMEWDEIIINEAIISLVVTLDFMTIQEILSHFNHDTTTLLVSPTTKIADQIINGRQTNLATKILLVDRRRFAMKVRSSMLLSSIILAVPREKEQIFTIPSLVKVNSPQVMVGH